MVQLSNIKDVFLASRLQQQERLCSGIEPFDDLLKGGLTIGKLHEFGVPVGTEGRKVLCSFLYRGIEKYRAPILWINCHKDLEIYPLGWFAAGVSMDCLYFVNSEAPISQLKPVFMSGYFKIIVLDSPRKLREEDCAFLTKMAAKNQQFLFLLRHYFLSNKHGNVWSASRINVDRDFRKGCYHLSVLKGSQYQKLVLSESLFNR